MLGVETAVIEVFGPVADDLSAIGVLQIDRVTVSATVLNGVVDELRRGSQFDVFAEVDCVVVFAAVDLTRPSLSHRVVSNDYPDGTSAAVAVREEVDSISAGALEYEPIDDHIALLACVRGHVHPVDSYRSLDRVGGGIGAVAQPNVEVRSGGVPVPASRLHRLYRTKL